MCWFTQTTVHARVLNSQFDLMPARFNVFFLLVKLVFVFVTSIGVSAALVDISTIETKTCEVGNSQVRTFRTLE